MADAFASRSLPHDALAGVLKRLAPHLNYALLGRPAEVRFQRLGPPPGQLDIASLDPCAWESGRCFGTTSEVRWRRRRDQWRVLVVGDTFDPTLTGELAEMLGEARELVREQAHYALLWGRRCPELIEGRPTWFEERIPRFLRYPWTEPDELLRLTVMAYRVEDEHDPAGAEHVYRFAGLSGVTTEAASDGEEA
jgi:hypothetical protein